MRYLLRVIDRISEWSGKIAMWGILIVACIVVYEVFTRRVLGSPHVWTYEIVTFFYGFHFMILAAYSLFLKGHVAIDIIYDRFSARTRAIMDLVTYLIFFFPFVIVLLWFGSGNALASWATNEKTSAARIAFVIPIMKSITPITALLLLLQGFALFYRRIFFYLKGEEI